MSISVSELWACYRGINPEAPLAVPDSYHFCDNQRDADLCAQLVVSGKKRATAPSLAELQLGGEPVPQVGDHAVITDWAGMAVAVIETLSVEIISFGAVDEAFARAEGEGDGTLKCWKAAHQRYYESVLAKSAYHVDDDLQIACVTFKAVLTA